MATPEPPVVTQFPTDTTDAQRRANAQLRTVLGDTYTFVRSAELTKTITSFTFDHYIDEAKREIKEDRVLRSASNPTVGVGIRPSKLKAIETLETNFNNSLSGLKNLAQKKDATDKGSA